MVTPSQGMEHAVGLQLVEITVALQVAWRPDLANVSLPDDLLFARLPAWISPLLPSTSLPRARRSATMDPPAGGSREPAVLPCCSGEKVTWLSVHEEWSSVKYLYTWPLLLIHVHGEEQTTAHSCFVPLLCATLLEVTFSYLSML